jgi:hypothetical protein
MAETNRISLPVDTRCFTDLDLPCATRGSNEVEEQHRATVNICVYPPFEASIIHIF